MVSCIGGAQNRVSNRVTEAVDVDLCAREAGQYLLERWLILLNELDPKLLLLWPTSGGGDTVSCGLAASCRSGSADGHQLLEEVAHTRISLLRPRCRR